MRVSIRRKGYVTVAKYLDFEKETERTLDLKLVEAGGGGVGPTETNEAKPAKPEKAAKPERAAGKAAAKPPAGGDPGFLVANTQPWAKVLIDGKDTGKTTPIAPMSKIPLKAGKHKVTFVANGKKYDFDIVVKPGEDFRLIKQLADTP